MLLLTINWLIRLYWVNNFHNLHQPSAHYYLVHFANATSNSSFLTGFNEERSSFIINFQDRITSLKEILQTLEERRNVLIRSEAARIERDKSVLYEITFANHEIRVNGFYLSKPVFNSPDDNFFAYVFDKPWQRISVEEIRKTVDLKKTVHQVLNDLGITGNYYARV